MKTNDLIELQVDRMSFGPAAVGRYTPPGESRAMVVFVKDAAPRERIRARLTRNNKTYWDAELVEILEPSPDRVAPPCPVFGRCGGCQWQHLSYEAQLREKQEVLIHQLSRALKVGTDELKAKLKVHAAPSPLGYRARLQAHGDKNGLGFFGPGSHEIVHTDNCVVAHPDIQRSWSEFRAKRPLAELAKATGQFKVEWSRVGTAGAVQVTEALNRKHGAFGFTQVNPEQNEALTRIVEMLAGTSIATHGVLFDLYGGDGNLSDRLLPRFGHVVSVDSYNDGPDPTTLTNPLPTGRTFVRESVEDFLVNQRWRDWSLDRIDCVIADPPRNGLRGAAEAIARLEAPRIILVSCDPSTLARDLTSLARYRLDEIHLIDMFPQTYHMETALRLSLT